MRDAANGDPLPDLAAPITVAVRYVPNPSFVEAGLALHRRATASEPWTSAGILTPTRQLDTSGHWLTTRVITLGQFILLAPPDPRSHIYLPIVRTGCRWDQAASCGGGW